MTGRVRSLTIPKLSAWLKLEILSANLAIGTASAFVLATAAVSLAVDRQAPTTFVPGNWSLRGSVSTIEIRQAVGVRLDSKERARPSLVEVRRNMVVL